MARTLSSGLALSLALGLVSTTVAPMVQMAPAQAQMAFSDVGSDNWARGFIQELAARDIVKGFPDGTFKPNEPVTRAQFAAMIRKAFTAAPVRSMVTFRDVPTTDWAYQSIQQAYTTGFMAGYPSNEFRPSDGIDRAGAIVSLASGLRLSGVANPEAVLQTFSDANAIPNYARGAIAAATTQKLVVNYPDVARLNPTQVATRAEVAAVIYQALNSQGQTAAIASPYIVGYRPVAQAVRLGAGTSIAVRSGQSKKILLARKEAQPMPLTVTVTRDVMTSSGRVAIPAGAQVTGNLVVTDGAAQFVAQEMTVQGKTTTIAATSQKLTTIETVRKGASTGTILKDAALGSAAAAGIAAVTGDRRIKAWEVLSGTAVGTLVGVVLGGEKVELIAIEPNADFNLQLTQDLVLGE